jgi:hypothetical protein
MSVPQNNKRTTDLQNSSEFESTYSKDHEIIRKPIKMSGLNTRQNEPSTSPLYYENVKKMVGTTQ